jgi:hypothetical protein
MPIVPLALGVQSNPGRAPAAGSARLVNCYVEQAGEEGKSPLPIYASEGLSPFATLTGGSTIRAAIGYDDAAFYAVSGTSVYRVLAAGGTTAALSGSISGAGRVGIARNRAGELGIVAGGVYYKVASDGTTLSTVDTSSLTGTLVDIVHIDGYFVLLMDTGEWYITAIDDAGAISELDFEDTASSPDGLVAGAKRGGDLVLFGEQSTEFWTNTGGGDFPFSRVTSKQYGCLSAGSVKALLMVAPGAPATEVIAFVGTTSEGAPAGVFLVDGYDAGRGHQRSVAQRDGAFACGAQGARRGHPH